MEERRKVFILSKPGLISSVVDRLFKPLSQFYEPVILEPNPDTGQLSILELFGNPRGNHCIVIIVYDYSPHWLEWLFEIRCKARFRGPCHLLGKSFPGKARSLKFQVLFPEFLKQYQDTFYYRDLYKMLSGDKPLPPLMPYQRFRRLQRKVRAFFLAITH